MPGFKAIDIFHVATWWISTVLAPMLVKHTHLSSSACIGSEPKPLQSHKQNPCDRTSMDSVCECMRGVVCVVLYAWCACRYALLSQWLFSAVLYTDVIFDVMLCYLCIWTENVANVLFKRYNSACCLKDAVCNLFC